MASSPSSSVGEEAGFATAGLDLVSGVFGYLAAQDASSIANSRADMIRTEALANADRYSQRAAQMEAHEKVMYLASGIKLAGSPVDALATQANITSQNINAILMQGDEQAIDEQIQGVNDQLKGRDALLKGFDSGLGAAVKGYSTTKTGSDAADLGIVANMISAAGK
jgi:hypothetical protein